MESIDEILIESKKCHSKQAWQLFIARHGSQIANCPSPRLVNELFKQLRQDNQSIHYDSRIWTSLINGCLSAWHLELGLEIAGFVRSRPAADIAIAAAKVYLESGFAASARELVARSLRLRNISKIEKLQLEMLLCSAHIEEGKRSTALRLLKRIEATTRALDLNRKDRADYLTYVARTLFLIGHYDKAAKLFADTSDTFLALEEWENAAKALFNAAASLDNSGTCSPSDRTAYKYVERCRRLSETHDLKGPLAHCDAFYGHNAYWLGNFAGAREHYRRALQHLPSSDKSYRRLHLLSMLAFTYLRTGRFSLARKFAQQTLDLAALEESDRFATRFENLHAEILWEEGEVERSQEIISDAVTPLQSKGVHTLEELSIVSRYILQTSMLGDIPNMEKFSIEESLRKNVAAWMEYLFALGQSCLAQERYEDAYKLFSECVRDSRKINNIYHEGLGQLGIVQTLLAKNADLAVIENEFEKLEVAAGQIAETPIKGIVRIVLAAIEYKRGHFELANQHLRTVSKSSRLSFCERFSLQAWLNTIEGKATRLTSPWQKSILARMTKAYFSPSIALESENVYLVSGQYPVNLQRHPQLSQLLQHLFESPGYACTLEELQTQVWRESLNTVGWKQKIRNTIMRLRDFFPFTVAPLLLHDEEVSLFKSAISIDPRSSSPANYREEIQRLLLEGPLSSVQLSNKLNVSSATTKRILKQLTVEDKITVFKVGRKVFYQKHATN